MTEKRRASHALGMFSHRSVLSVDSERRIFGCTLCDDVSRSAAEKSKGEGHGSGDADLPKVKYTNIPTESDGKNTSSSRNSAEGGGKADAAHVDQKEFDDDVTESGKTALFCSKCYTVNVRLRAKKELYG